MEIKGIIFGGLIIVVFAIGIKAFAQSKLSEEKAVKRTTEKMARHLNLTVEQKDKVYAINLQRSRAHDEAYQAGRNKEIIVQSVQKWEKDLKNVLTVEQQKHLQV